MKRRLCNGSLLALFLCASTIQARGQGQIIFYNSGLINPSTGGAYRAGIFQDNGDLISGNSTIGAGPAFTAALYLQSDPDADPPLATTTFRSDTAPEIFAQRQVVTIPGVKPGERARLVLRVWETARGSYQAAEQGGGQIGAYWFESQPLGDTSPADLYPFPGGELAPVLTPLASYQWGFEGWYVNDGGISFIPPTAWSLYNINAQGPWTGDGGGVINPTGSPYFANGAPEGRQAGFVLLSSAATNEGGLKRATQSVLSPRRRYTLMVEVGNPSGQTSDGVLNFAGCPGYRVDLTAGTSVLASDDNSLSIPEGEFRKSKTVFTSGDTHVAFGQSVKVRLVNLRQPGTPDAPGLAVAFDDIRFFDEPLQPTIAVRAQVHGSLELNWTDASETFTPEAANDPAATLWEPLPGAISDANGNHSLPIAPTATSSFFRLRGNP